MKAFPTEHAVAGTMDLQADGMDLRDYFAAKAMQSFLTIHPKEWDEMYPDADSMAVNVPTLAYQFADAMMEARKK